MNKPSVVPVLVGERVPPSWRGEARGVFEHAANVFLTSPAPGGAPSVLTLLDVPRNMGERCVVLEPGLFARLRDAWERDGEAEAAPCAVCENGALDCGPELPLLDLAAAPRWHTPDLTARGPASGRMLRRARQALGPANHPEPWGGAVFRRFDLWAAGQGSLGDVVGAGPGMTPAGDDMLMGFICGLYASRAYSVEASLRLDGLRRELPPLLSRTNAVSAAFLEDALSGSFHRPLSRLCLALHPGSVIRRERRRSPEETAEDALAEALAFGAGSGREGAYGLFTALWLVRPWRDAR